MLRFLLFVSALLICLSTVEAQRGGRGGRSSRTTKSTNRGDRAPSNDWTKNLWYGASGTAGFQSFNGESIARLGVLPQVGYKFGDVFSAGPRFGAEWTNFKGTTSNGSRQRVNLWDLTGGLFARAKVYQFFAQVESNYISFQEVALDPFGRLAIDDNTGLILTQRESVVELLVGAGYNAGVGQGLSSEFGVFYNLFDDADSFRPAIQFRVSLTFNY